MVKRSSRLAKRNELKAIEDAIGSSLGKKPAAVTKEREGAGDVKEATQASQQRSPRNK
jgi:hypothetical protein